MASCLTLLTLFVGLVLSEDFGLADATTATEKADHAFKAEINQLMKLIINSLYSNRDIFVRELISNAADALDKIRYLSLTDPTALSSAPQLDIRVKVDVENRLIHFRDTGIGMTQADLINNLGSIAKSGTRDFLKEMQAGKKDLTQIGQFGVGFYSSFLVADRVTVTSKNNKDDQFIWESSMDDAAQFTIYQDPRGNTLGRGTQITLHVKEDQLEYLQPAKLKELIRHYNEFITFPIFLWDSHEETVEEPEVPPVDVEGDLKVEEEEEAEEVPEAPKTQTVWGWDQINTAQPLWTRPPTEVTQDEYSKFFQSLGDYEDPIAHTHFKAEGELEFTALIYIPSRVADRTWDFANLKSGVKLYVKRVFISEKFDDLLPSYLSFVKGVTDSDDLPLNVSREMLQKSALLKAIQRKLVRKVIQMIQDLADDEDQTKFEQFTKQFSQFLKVGVTRDTANRARLAKLLRFPSLNSQPEKVIGFDQYVENLKEGQSSIYFLGGDNEAALRKSPLLERAKRKGIDVLLFTQPIDEYMASALGSYDGKYQLIDISKSGIKLEGDDVTEETETKFKPLVDYLTETLKGQVSKVQLSSRLTSTPCALVSSQWAMSSNMERIVRAQALQEGQAWQNRITKKVLEINPRHPIIKKLLVTVEASEQSEETVDVVKILFDSAALHSGVPLDDPLSVANRLDKVIGHALSVSPDELPEEEEIAILPVKAKPADPATQGVTVNSEPEHEEL